MGRSRVPQGGKKAPNLYTSTGLLPWSWGVVGPWNHGEMTPVMSSNATDLPNLPHFVNGICLPVVFWFNQHLFQSPEAFQHRGTCISAEWRNPHCHWSHRCYYKMFNHPPYCRPSSSAAASSWSWAPLFTRSQASPKEWQSSVHSTLKSSIKVIDHKVC